MISKSFRYDPQKHPKVQKWIDYLQENNMDFSKAIRQLIESNKDESDDLRKEVQEIKRQLANLNKQGVVVSSEENPHMVELSSVTMTETINEPSPQINSKFIKNRYF
jgi:seryl-tRNA synthetase